MRGCLRGWHCLPRLRILGPAHPGCPWGWRGSVRPRKHGIGSGPELLRLRRCLLFQQDETFPLWHSGCAVPASRE